MVAKQKRVIRKPASQLPWVIAVIAGIALALVLTIGRKPAAPSHPEPRAEAAGLGESVMPASFFTGNPRVVSAYQLARKIPATLDGLYCHCHCKESVGHRSLLTCFQSDHGSGCDVCIGEAELAEQMAALGKSLPEIQAQVDVAFGR